MWWVIWHDEKIRMGDGSGEAFGKTGVGIKWEEDSCRDSGRLWPSFILNV